MTLREWTEARLQQPRFGVVGLILLLVLLLGLSLSLKDSQFRHELIERAMLARAQAVQASLGHLESDMAFAEASVDHFGRMMSFRSEDLAQEDGDFMALLEKEADGAWRSRQDDGDAGARTALWIPPGAVLDADAGRLFLRARRLATLFGNGLASRHVIDTWQMPVGNREVIFHPAGAHLALDATAGSDARTAWLQLTAPTRNPHGHPRWTAPTYDPVLKDWVVSVVVPYFRDGRWAGAVGHDLLLSHLVADLTVSAGPTDTPLVPGFVARRNGELLLGKGTVGGRGELVPEPYRGLLAKAVDEGVAFAALDDRRFIVAALPGLEVHALYELDSAEPGASSDEHANTLHLALDLLIGLVVAPLLGYVAAGAVQRRMPGAQLEGRNRDLESMVQERTSELEEANARLEALMLQDHLTGLGNRRAFDAGLERAWGRARRRREPLAVVLLDVDQFKRYNDHFGHQQGDACLRIVGRVIRESTRRPDDLPFRYGGEEFGLLLPDTDTAGALRVAELLRVMVLAQQVTHPGSPHGLVTVSLGVAACTAEQDLTAEALVARADAALYRAKQNGRNRVEAASN